MVSRVRFYLCLSLAAVFLPHCATKHQPIRFDPYFPETPVLYDSKRLLSEVAELEGEETLSALEKKKLFDLYSIEGRTLKSSSSRFAFC